MGRAPAVEVEGAAQLAASLRRCGSDLENLKAHTRVAAYVAGAAATRAPRRSGRLAASVRGTRGKASADLGSSLVYAGVQHWGWPAHHITGRPFLSEAATSTEPTWLRMYFADVEAAVAKVRGA